MGVITPPNFKKAYNIEKFFVEMEQFLKDNVNPFIDKMNADKPDLTLKSIDNAAYFFQTMNETTVNFDPFIFYGEQPSTIKGINSSTSNIYEVDVAVIMSIGNEDAYVAGNKLLRYRQILENLFEIGWNQVNNRVKIEVSSMSPFPFELTNSSNPYAGIGVTLEVGLS